MNKKNDINQQIIALFKNIDEHDGLFDVIGTYLDAIIYLLVNKGVISQEELEMALAEVSKQNQIDKTKEQLRDLRYQSGFMNPPMGDA